MNKDEYKKLTLKSMDYIENIIKRMSDNSLKIKGYSLIFFSLIISILKFTYNINKITYIGIFTSIFLASLLNTYYLNIEREYRNLYEVARKSLIYYKSNYYHPLNLRIPQNKYINIFHAWSSFSVLGFYIIITIIACLFLYE